MRIFLFFVEEKKGGILSNMRRAHPSFYEREIEEKQERYCPAQIIVFKIMSPAVFDFDEIFSFGRKKKRVSGSTRADFPSLFLFL